MRLVSLLLLIVASTASGCGPSRVNVLEQELSAYKLQGEELRRNDLEEAYREERERSEELVGKISSARAEYDRLNAAMAGHEADVAKLRQQVAKLEAQKKAHAARLAAIKKEIAAIAAEQARLEKEKGDGG